MRKQILITVALTLTMMAGSGATSLRAQDNLLNRVQSGFSTGSADVVKVTFNRLDPTTGAVGVQLDPADENLVIKSGERIRVSIESNFPAYVYIINIGPGGTRVIYPTSLARVVFNRAYNKTMMDLEADQKPGRDALLVITSRTRVPKFDEAIQGRKVYGETFSDLEMTQAFAPVVSSDGVGGAAVEVPKKKSKWARFFKGAIPVVARVFGIPVPYLGKDFNVVENSVTNESFAYVSDPSGKLPSNNQRGVIAIVFDHH